MGRTGLKVTEVCLGTMTFGNQCDEPTSFEIMDVAYEAGITFFDTADVYPLGGTAEVRGLTEVFVGNWLKQRGLRDKIVLATKCRMQMGDGPNEQGLSRKYIFSAVEASLRRLQTDYIDLYQVHSPDPETPIDETLLALNDLVREGKIRYIGCSNYPAWQLATALWTSDKLGIARFDCDQPRYNILYREIENEILPLCRAQGVGVICYNPLAGGFLTGRYNPGQQVEQSGRFALHGAGQLYQKRYWNDYMFSAVEELKQYFSGRGKSLTHVALSWVLAQNGITSAIVGASKPEQLRDSLQGVEMQLDEEEMKMCNSIWYRLPRIENPEIALR
jgi:aryl-alcohol dehydrogenase-like predicted oxidoreductase